MAAAGMLDKQIGHELGLSLNTLRTYWQRIRVKLGNAPRAGLVSRFVQEDLRNSETKDLDLLPHEGVIIDVEKGLMLAADSVNDMHGLTHGAWHPLVAYANIYHPDDKEDARKIIYDVIEGRIESAHVVFRLVPDTGVEVVSVSFHAVRDSSGNVKRVYGYRVRALDCRPGHDPEVKIGQWERWSDSEDMTIDAGFAEILGLPESGVYSRHVITELVHPEDRERMMAFVPDAIERGEQQAQADARVSGDEGSHYWVRTKATIVEHPDGRYRILGTAAVFR